MEDSAGFAGDEVDGGLVVVEGDVLPGDAFLLILLLLQLEDVFVEVILQVLIRVVNAHLLKAVLQEVLDTRCIVVITHLHNVVVHTVVVNNVVVHSVVVHNIVLHVVVVHSVVVHSVVVYSVVVHCVVVYSVVVHNVVVYKVVVYNVVVHNVVAHSVVVQGVVVHNVVVHNIVVQECTCNDNNSADRVAIIWTYYEKHYVITRWLRDLFYH